MEGRNFGDEIARLLLESRYGVKVEPSDLEDADAIGVGSLLNQVYGTSRLDHRELPLRIVGAGFMHPYVLASPKKPVDVISVRGHLSRQMLPPDIQAKILLGDPGLLISELDWIRNVDEKFSVGIIPHITRFNDTELLARFDSIESKRVINFRTTNVSETLNSILACDFIVSQSLHGLIISDSLGKPNAWLHDRALHMGGEFKFFDYFSSIARPFEKRIPDSLEITMQHVRDSSFELASVKKYKIQDQIDDSFEKLIATLDRGD